MLKMFLLYTVRFIYGPISPPPFLIPPHPGLFGSGRVPIAGYLVITILTPFKVALLGLFILSPTIQFLFEPGFLNQVDKPFYFFSSSFQQLVM